MRTIKQKMISAVVLVITLLTAQTAFAYYNPSTGRWLSRDPIGEPGFQALQMAKGNYQVGPVPVAQQSSRWVSRDPIGEKGGLNLYGFVRNQPVSLFDVLGLECKCGPDITDAFYGYLRSIVTELKSQPDNLTGMIDGVATLSEIGPNIDFWYNGKLDGCATESCRGTVWFSGTCVRSTVINNILYGFVANALSVAEHDAAKGASFHNKMTNGSFEGPEQEGAYDIGYELWDQMGGWGSTSTGDLDNVVGNATTWLPVDSLKYWFNSKLAVGKAFKQCNPCGKSISIKDVGRVGNGFSSPKGQFPSPRTGGS